MKFNSIVIIMNKITQVLVLAILTCVFSISTFAQNYEDLPFVKGVVYLENGEVLESEVGLLDKDAKHVFVKEANSSIPRKYLNNEVLKVEYLIDDEIHKFDKLEFARKKKTTIRWAELLVDGPAKLYKTTSVIKQSGSPSHKMDAKGNMVPWGGLWIGAKFVESFDWFCIREGEDKYTLVAMDIQGALAAGGYERSFRTFSAKYFSDYEALAKDIKGKKYKIEEIEKLVERYNEWALQSE